MSNQEYNNLNRTPLSALSLVPSGLLLEWLSDKPHNLRVGILNVLARHQKTKPH